MCRWMPQNDGVVERSSLTLLPNEDPTAIYFGITFISHTRTNSTFYEITYDFKIKPGDKHLKKHKRLKISTEARFVSFWVAKCPFSKPLLHRRLKGGVNFSESANRIEASWPPQKQPETSFCFEKACFHKGYWRKRDKSRQRGNLQTFVCLQTIVSWLYTGSLDPGLFKNKETRWKSFWNFCFGIFGQ